MKPQNSISKNIHWNVAKPVSGMYIGYLCICMHSKFCCHTPHIKVESKKPINIWYSSIYADTLNSFNITNFHYKKFTDEMKEENLEWTFQTYQPFRLDPVTCRKILIRNHDSSQIPDMHFGIDLLSPSTGIEVNSYIYIYIFFIELSEDIFKPLSSSLNLSMIQLSKNGPVCSHKSYLLKSKVPHYV